MRTVLALLVVVSACWVSHNYSEHHSGSNDFETLYMHLVPARLVSHGEAAEGSGEVHHAVEEHGEAAGHGEVAPDHDATHGGGHAQKPLLEVPLPAALSIFDHRGAVPEGEGPRTALFNLQLFQVAAVLLVLILFSGVPGYVRTGRGDKLSRLLTGFAMWVRDEMVYPEMGKELGRKFLPYFLSVFFFILFMNLLGLVPFMHTATGNIAVTASLAFMTFLVMQISGIREQGLVHYAKNIVPPGIPLWLYPIMLPVEILGMLTKPFALTIRLFANMTAGHVVILSLFGLLFFFKSIFIAPAVLGFVLFVDALELLVAFLQAYIFTFLSILFVNACAHPEH